MKNLIQIIDNAWNDNTLLKGTEASNAVEHVIALLDSG